MGSVQFSRSVVSDSLQPHELQHARPPCPSPTPGVHSNSRPLSLWCHPAISSCRPLFLLPPIPPSIRVFSNESTLRMRWPKYWSFSFSIIPSKEHPGLISFRIDWLDLLAYGGHLQIFVESLNGLSSLKWKRNLMKKNVWWHQVSGCKLLETLVWYLGRIYFMKERGGTRGNHQIRQVCQGGVNMECQKFHDGKSFMKDRKKWETKA